MAVAGALAPARRLAGDTGSCLEFKKDMSSYLY
jgi:hypothetical protein